MNSRSSGLLMFMCIVVLEHLIHGFLRPSISARQNHFRLKHFRWSHHCLKQGCKMRFVLLKQGHSMKDPAAPPYPSFGCAPQISFVNVCLLLICRQMLSLRLQQMIRSHCDEAIKLLNSGANKLSPIPGTQEVLMQLFQ